MAVAVSCSLIAVKPARSENRTVATRRSAWSRSSFEVSMTRATTRGSRYFPKVSLIRSLLRSSSAMRLKAWASWPISCLDGLGPFHDQPERPNEALGTGRAHPKAEDHRDHEQDDIQAQEARLLRVEAQDRGIS